MDFVNTVAKDLGYPPVPRYPIQRPTEFLERLKRNIAVEDYRRGQERQLNEKRAAEEARRQAEEENNRYYVQVWNVDDKITVELNGQFVFSVQDGQSSGRVMLDVQPGAKHLVLRLFNTVGGVTWSYTIWKNSNVIANDSCGTFHVAACGGASVVYPAGLVWERALDLN